jgi:putative ABC transport system permease protein
MFRLTLKTIAAQKARFFLTAVAVILGVAFMAGTLVLTDTIKQSYDDLTNGVYENTDAVVRSASSVEGEAGQETRAGIDAALVDTVKAVPGVEAAEAQILGIAIVVDDNGELLENSPNRPIPIATSWHANDQLNPMELVEGHAPAANEIVIDVKSAEKGGWKVGDTISVLNKAGTQKYQLAGIATYSGQDDAAGAQVVAFAPETASLVLGEPGRIDAVHVVAADGVSETELAANLSKALAQSGNELEVLTGTQALEDAREATGAQLEFLNMFLLTFAIVALLVGSFVIYNTFSITVAQRTKNTALLRAIGAKRKQVMRALVFESFLTGVFASAIGVLAGIGTAKGIAQAFKILDIELPSTGTVVKSSTVVTSIVVGTIVTVLAAYLPARRSGKVPPIAALRDVAIDRSGTSKKRAVFGTLVTVLGALSMASGLSNSEFGPVGLGALFVFVGVAALGPVIARPFARLIGSPLPKVRGMAGTIARENATRNPKRTAATSSALMIGVGLVAFITVFAASTKTSFGESLDNSVRSDWIVETAWGMGGLSPQATAEIDALPETGSVTPLRFTTASVNGSSVDLLGYDPTVEDGVDLHYLAGTDELGPNEVAVWQSTADDKGLAIGDTVPVVFAETGEQQFRVAGIYEEQGPSSGYVVSLDTFNANVAEHVDNYLAVNNAPGVSTEEARSAIESVLDKYPNASVKTQEEFKGAMANQIDKMLNLVYVLLFMALAIALFGIANTLALSVFERTREIGLLRAVGMSRKQLRQSVRWESVLIALLGTTLGMGIGLGFGYAMVQAMKDKGVGTLDVPTTQLFVIVGLAAVAAVAAAAFPARRAGRMDVLDSISTGQ